MPFLSWLLALLVGYLVGSLPLSTWIGRAGGIDVARAGLTAPSAAGVWRLAGPGWGVLALTGDLARGILPVALGIVTFDWWTGWVAGLGVLAGAAWPGLGRRRGERGVAAPAGIAIALAPPAGVVAIITALPAAAVSRLVGQRAITTGIAGWVVAYPVLFLLEHRDPVRLAGIGILFVAAGAWYARGRR